jgi:hypothetical protein
MPLPTDDDCRLDTAPQNNVFHPNPADDYPYFFNVPTEPESDIEESEADEAP